MKCWFYVIRDGHQVGPFYAASMRGALGHIPTIVEREDLMLGHVYQMRCAAEQMRQQTRRNRRLCQSLRDKVAYWRAKNVEVRGRIQRKNDELAVMKAAVAMVRPNGPRGHA